MGFTDLAGAEKIRRMEPGHPRPVLESRSEGTPTPMAYPRSVSQSVIAP